MAIADHLNAGRLLRTLLLILTALFAISTEAAPLGIGPNERPSPDLLLCVVIYWSLRRPGSTPMLLVFALGIVRDLLTDVPVGAGALSLVLVSEVFKGMRRRFARSSFALEWFAVFIAAALSALMQWFLVLVTLAHPPYLTDLWNQVLYTALLYPVLVVIFRWLMRISWRRIEAI